MNREALDTAIRAEFYAEEAWNFATTGKSSTPGHVFKWVSKDIMQAISTATGAQIRRCGEGTTSTYVLDYGGCIFQAARGEED